MFCFLVVDWVCEFGCQNMYLEFCKGEEVCLYIRSQDHSLVQIVSALYSAGQDRL